MARNAQELAERLRNLVVELGWSPEEAAEINEAADLLSAPPVLSQLTKCDQGRLWEIADWIERTKHPDDAGADEAEESLRSLASRASSGGEGRVTITISREGAESFISDSAGWGAIGEQEIDEAIRAALSQQPEEDRVPLCPVDAKRRISYHEQRIAELREQSEEEG